MKTKLFLLSSAFALMSCSVFAKSAPVENGQPYLFNPVTDTIPSDTIPQDTLPKKDTMQTVSTATALKANANFHSTSQHSFYMKEPVVAISPAKEEYTF